MCDQEHARDLAHVRRPRRTSSTGEVTIGPSALGRRLGTHMAEAREARRMPDLAIDLVVRVRVELALVQEVAARGAPVVIGTAAMHVHHLTRERGARIEAPAAPLATARAADEPAGDAVRLPASQQDGLLERRRPTTLREIAPVLGGETSGDRAAGSSCLQPAASLPGSRGATT